MTKDGSVFGSFRALCGGHGRRAVGADQAVRCSYEQGLLEAAV